MTDNPIINRYRQNTHDLVTLLSHQLRQHNNADLAHTLNQFKHRYEAARQRGEAGSDFPTLLQVLLDEFDTA